MNNNAHARLSSFFFCINAYEVEDESFANLEYYEIIQNKFSNFLLQYFPPDTKSRNHNMLFLRFPCFVQLQNAECRFPLMHSMFTYICVLMKVKVTGKFIYVLVL